jgi:UDP-N-acetylglucosamine--N-acetylmuramyl-(pentapeptide) pyrophosphoryl-undecaprenol N-acetylglucosamine transferase
MLSIAFTGGGTGGHIYPGLAVASALQRLMPCRIFWIGSAGGMDRSIVERAGLEFFGIPSGKLRRYFSPRNVSDLFRVLGGFFAARRVLRREKPALLFSKGGFVSVPPCAAGASLKIPVFTHESDYSPGLATRINARFAEKIFIPYGESAAFFPPALRNKAEVSGNPIRPAFAGAEAARGRAFLGIPEGEPVLLVLGGSLGSREINDLVRACLPGLTRRYTVVHQTGVQDETFAPQERYKPYPYFNDEMPHIIAAADLVLCRSGAGTIWECAGLKKPMILLPLRGSGTRGDQVENARLFEKAGAALNLAEASPDDPPAERLLSVLTLPGVIEKLKRSAALARFDGLGSADFIARILIRKITEEQ